MALRYNPYNRFPTTNPLPEYGDDKPDDEPYNNRVWQALLDVRGPASARKNEWGVCSNYGRGTGGADMTWPHGVCMWLPGDVQRKVQDTLDAAVTRGIRRSNRPAQVPDHGNGKEVVLELITHHGNDDW